MEQLIPHMDDDKYAELYESDVKNLSYYYWKQRIQWKAIPLKKEF
jgi:hypothetical protein